MTEYRVTQTAEITPAVVLKNAADPPGEACLGIRKKENGMKKLTELNTEEWIGRVRGLPRAGEEKVLIFYDHRIGGMCRDPRFMLIPLDDHMVHRGDGVFESLHVTEGRILELDAHLERLRHSCGVLELEPPCAWDELRDIVLAVTSAAGEKYCAVKVLLGRGPGGMGVDPAECPESSFFVIVTRSSPLPESFWERGLTACRSAVPAKQPWLAGIKSTNYLPNALMTSEARKHGVDVTFSFDEKGFLAEAAIANVGVIDAEGRLLMPRFTHALPGTTALLAMELAKSMMDVIITDITEEILYAASEILIFGTGPECVAVTHYGGKPVGSGRPGPSGRRLRAVLHEALLAGGTPLLES